MLKILSMEQLQLYIQDNIQFAPLIIFSLLCLAGFNLPVSEDAMIILSALLAKANPSYTVYLFLGVYSGAYISDLICYSLGRFLGPQIFSIKFFSNIVKQKQINRMKKFYDKWGIIILIPGRFIPFGVRNALFLTAGLGKMNFIKFALADLLACTISNLVLFSITYYMGEVIITYVKKGNIFIFATAAVIVFSIILIKKIAKRKPGKDYK